MEAKTCMIDNIGHVTFPLVPSPKHIGVQQGVQAVWHHLRDTTLHALDISMITFVTFFLENSGTLFAKLFITMSGS